MGRELPHREFLALGASGYPGWETITERHERVTHDPVSGEHRRETTVVTRPFVVEMVPTREQWIDASAGRRPEGPGRRGLLLDFFRRWCREKLEGDHHCSWHAPSGSVVCRFQRGDEAAAFRLVWDRGG
jgi:hypothetical protein